MSDYAVVVENHPGEINVLKFVKEVIKNRYDPEEDAPPRPDYLISIDGKGVALPGSLIALYGPPKSRKSSLMAMIAASCISKKKKVGHITSGVKGRVLWFDTEMSDIEVKYFQDNVLRLAGLDPKADADYINLNYQALKLRSYDEVERLAIIDVILSSVETNQDVGLVVIDGIADLLYNTNDMESSKKLVTYFTQWADKLGIPVITGMHTTKDGTDATGFLGGFLNKKASYTIKTSKDVQDGASTVQPYFVRNGENFTPFAIDNQSKEGEHPGLPIFVSVSQTQREADSTYGEEGERRSKSRKDKTVNELREEKGKNLHEKEESSIFVEDPKKIKYTHSIVTEQTTRKKPLSNDPLESLFTGNSVREKV